MSSKVANLIALELGILIAILAWLAFFEFSQTKSSPRSEDPERADGAFATVAPVVKPTYQRRSPIDYAAELAAEQLREEREAQYAEEYDEPIAAAPEAASAPEAYLFDPAATNDAGIYDEPFFGSPDCFVPLDQFVVYPQSSAIVFVANSQARFRHPRGMARRGGGGRTMAVPPRSFIRPQPPARTERQRRAQPQPRTGGVVPRGDAPQRPRGKVKPVPRAIR